MEALSEGATWLKTPDEAWRKVLEIAGNQSNNLRFSIQNCVWISSIQARFDEISGCFDILDVSACEEYAYRI